MQNYRVGYIVDGDGEPTAVFTDSAADCRPGRVLVFTRRGEHAEADIAWVRRQQLAEPAAWEALHEYLARRYGQPPGECVQLVIDQDAVPR